MGACLVYTLVLGTLGEIPSTAALVLEELGVRGSELDKLLASWTFIYDSG